MATDGTIFTTGPGGVLVLSKDGKRLGRISDGKATANCKFGDDGKTLYLTSHEHAGAHPAERHRRGILTISRAGR